MTARSAPVRLFLSIPRDRLHARDRRAAAAVSTAAPAYAASALPRAGHGYRHLPLTESEAKA